jgi:alpha-D-ribose 1-methylphosphonate 5-triphosphate synthase subunit PhnG
MCDDADLPDHDYESIYGREAMHARVLARLDAALQRIEARSAAVSAEVARLKKVLRGELAEEGSQSPTDT